MARRPPHRWLRDEVLQTVAAVVTRRDGVEHWAIKPAGRLARFRARRVLPREVAQRELRLRHRSRARWTAYRDDRPDGPLSPG